MSMFGLASTRARERLLGHQEDLAEPASRRRAGSCRRAVDRRRLEQLPAVEDRLGVDPRSAAAGGPDGEVEVRAELRAGALVELADPAEHGAADYPRALPEGPELDLRRLEPQHLREVDPEDLEAGLVERAAPSPRRCRGCRAGSGRRTGAPSRASACAATPVAAGASEACWTRAGRRCPPVALAAGAGRSVGFGQVLLARRAWRRGTRPARGGLSKLSRHRVALRDLAEVRVRVAVAVDVLQDDVAAELACCCRPS